MESDLTPTRNESVAWPKDSAERQGRGAYPSPPPIGNDAKTPVFDPFSKPSESTRKTRTAQRLKYEAEAHLLKKKIGDLETIRTRLNLSQRKMCQLLLVDPSAWTRWIRPGGEAPPHIFRALQWFLALEDKYPALDPTFWLQTVARTEEPNRLEAHGRELRSAVSELGDLRAEIGRLQATSASLLDENHRQRKALHRLWWLVAGLAVFALTAFGIFLARLS